MPAHKHQHSQCGKSCLTLRNEKDSRSTEPVNTPAPAFYPPGRVGWGAPVSSHCQLNHGPGPGGLGNPFTEGGEPLPVLDLVAQIPAASVAPIDAGVAELDLLSITGILEKHGRGQSRVPGVASRGVDIHNDIKNIQAGAEVHLNLRFAVTRSLHLHGADVLAGLDLEGTHPLPAVKVLVHFRRDLAQAEAANGAPALARSGRTRDVDLQARLDLARTLDRRGLKAAAERERRRVQDDARAKTLEATARAAAWAKRLLEPSGRG